VYDAARMPPATRWLLRLGFGVLVLGVVGWAYADLASAELTSWDDDRFITYNPLFQTGGWTYISAAFTQIQFEAYQPLHLISYLPDRYLWPSWPVGFHLLNLVWFATDLVLVWRLVRRHTSPLAAVAAVAVVALHPLCVEPVAWVTDRKDLVMIAFVLLALGREDRSQGFRPQPWAVIAYLCALLTKSSSVCFPILLFAWLTWVDRRPWREALVRSASYLVAAVVISVLVFAVWRDHGMIADDTARSRLIEVASTVATYAQHVVWPVDLAPVYPTEIAHPEAALVVCVIAALVLASLWKWLPPRSRFAIVAVAGALAPVSNFVPMTLRYADRYLFVVLILLVLPLASALDWLAGRARLAAAAIAAVVVIVVGFEASATAHLVATWRSSRTLWTHAVASQPATFLGHLKLGEALEADRQWRDAITQLRMAQKITPTSILPVEQLFQLDCERAEANGILAPGTATRWQELVDRAATDRAVFQQLTDEAAATKCRTCSHALLLLELSIWPRSDDELLALAGQAIAQRSWQEGRIYLGQVRDRSRPELGPLTKLELDAAPAP
jgi:hypothetical protein